MKEEDIVKKVCEIMGVNYSHYDNHSMDLYYFDPIRLISKPKIVVYSSEYGSWEFAILEDMSVITPMINYNKAMKSIYVRMSELGTPTEREKEHYRVIIAEENKISNAEQFLKDNDCASVINDVNKKINWV
jgi:hypothetical protein